MAEFAGVGCLDLNPKYSQQQQQTELLSKFFSMIECILDVESAR